MSTITSMKVSENGKTSKVFQFSQMYTSEVASRVDEYTENVVP